MISGFGAHYRLYRLASALDRLRDLPPNTQISLAKAGRLLGMKETDVRTLLQRHAPHEQIERNRVSAATLRHVIMQARNRNKPH